MSLDYFFSTFLNFLFPLSDEEFLVSTLTEKDILALYTPRYFESIHILSQYQNKQIRALIHEAKFHSNKEAWHLLHFLLTKHLVQIKPSVHYIIPIPLSRARLRTRGYNQVTKILMAKPLHTQFTVSDNILTRTKNTRPQTELTRKKRLVNLNEAFGVMHGERITGKNVLLIDDVATTGATLHTAKAALLPYAPASITCIALAH